MSALALILKSALRELLKTKKKLIGVFFILVIGFLGPLFASALASSVQNYIQFRSRQLLSADLAVANTKEFRQDETDIIGRVTHAIGRSEATEFVTMAAGRGVSTLVEIQAVDESFPIYGRFQFKDGHETTNAKELNQKNITWVFPEVLAQLGLQEGDVLKVGTLEVRIAGVLKDAPGLSRSGIFAPRLFIGQTGLAQTGLLKFGSQVQYRMYVRLPQNVAAPIAAANVKSIFGSADITIRTPDDSAQSLAKFFTFFNLYLSSISMIIFALSWVSAFYILQVYLHERLRNSAVRLIFGASRSRVLGISSLQVFMIMLTGLLVSSVLVFAAVGVANHRLSDLLPPGFELRFAPSDFAKMLAICLVSAGAFVMPTAIRLRTQSLNDLLSETGSGAGRLSLPLSLFAYSPLAVIFVGLAMWLMNSVRDALLLTSSLLFSVLFGWCAARVLFALFFKIVRKKPGTARLVATQLVRSRFGTTLCFITILIAALELNLVPHLMASALKELQPLQGHQMPALFLFNIPESGVESLKAFADQRRFELKYLAPMVLGRVTRVNGEPSANEMFQRFPVRLTYRSNLIPSEKLVRGHLPLGIAGASERGGISIEDGFADRTGLKFGDEIDFEVQGVPVQGKITSVRKVRWTDFNPNFFMVLQPGLIDDAPKTYLASVFLGAGTDKVKTQYDLVHDFPDISSLDVSRMLEKVMEIASSIIGPVQVASGLAVVMSFLILTGVILHNLGLRRRELEIQKLLGADTGLIRRLIVFEYFLLALTAAVVASVSAIALTALTTNVIFDIQMSIDRTAVFIAVIGTTLLTSVLTLWAVTKVLKLRAPLTRL